MTEREVTEHWEDAITPRSRRRVHRMIRKMAGFKNGMDFSDLDKYRF